MFPGSVALADEVDRSALRRAFLATAARFAPIDRSSVVAGDGEETASFRLVGDRGAVELRLTRNQETNRLTKVVFVPVNLEPPYLAD
jgi:hypothetical protein